MDALFLYSDHPREKNTSYYRVLIPVEFLCKAGDDIKAVDLHDFDYNLVPKVVVVEREVTPELVDRLRLCGATRIIVTFDDCYDFLPPNSSASHYWSVYLDEFKVALGMVDEVIVPSEMLAGFYKKWCRKISVVPNFLDPRLWMPEKRPESNGEVVVGWGGSNAHSISLRDSGVLDALASLIENNNRVRLDLYAQGAARQVISEHRVSEYARIYDWVPFTEWPKRVRGWDIGLAPLSGKYDKYRSTLKPLEYATCGLPFVCTDMAPYFGVQGGLQVTRGEYQWLGALEKLADSIMYGGKLHGDLVNDGQAWAKEYSVERLVRVYREVLFK